MKKNVTLFLGALVLSALAWADPAVKYAGPFTVPANNQHRGDITGSISLSFDGDQLAQVLLKTDKPVFGQTDFPSTEQVVFSNATATPAQMTVLFKVKGPPHKWYYVYALTTADEGKTFTGTIYKGTDTLDVLEKAMTNGTLSTYKVMGTGTLTAQ